MLSAVMMENFCCDCENLQNVLEWVLAFAGRLRYYMHSLKNARHSYLRPSDRITDITAKKMIPTGILCPTISGTVRNDFCVPFSQLMYIQLTTRLCDELSPIWGGVGLL